MADTIDIGKLAKGFGPGLKIAVGTVAGIAQEGSFSILLKAPGSQCLRDIVACFVTPMGGPAGGSVSTVAKGSSNGYITVHHNIVGTPLPTGGTLNIDLSFLAIARSGSL